MATGQSPWPSQEEFDRRDRKNWQKEKYRLKQKVLPTGVSPETMAERNPDGTRVTYDPWFKRHPELWYRHGYPKVNPNREYPKKYWEISTGEAIDNFTRAVAEATREHGTGEMVIPRSSMSIFPNRMLRDNPSIMDFISVAPTGNEKLDQGFAPFRRWIFDRRKEKIKAGAQKALDIINRYNSRK